MSTKYDKLTAQELKEKVKSIGMVSSGEKGTLVFRLKLWDKCTNLDLRTSEGTNPCSLKFSDLKKIAAGAGVSPIGTQDEILDAYIKHLESNKPITVSSGTSTSSSSDTNVSGNSNNNASEAISIAKKVLELGESEDYEGILNIATSSTEPITKNTPSSQMRKAYLKLSLLIHPDKIGRYYDQATKAFQELVKAFDYLSTIDIDTSGDTNDDDTDTTTSSKSKKSKSTKIHTISRSNEGCYRTRICCPRCTQPWSENTLDGNPDYFYNFIMQGLKSYTCSTCLCEFGCMTGRHKCPHCSRTYEYDITMYHQKIHCPHSTCNKLFGFYLFPISDLRIKQMRLQIKQEHDERIKIHESKLRRAGRRLQKTTLHDQEKAFIIGLLDNCPRCGESFEGYPDENIHREHLISCTDSKAHQAYQIMLAKKEAKQEKKDMKKDAQENIQAQAAWTFLGAQSNQLWLLNEVQVKEEGKRIGVSIVGDKDEIIDRIVRKKEMENEVMISNSSSSSSSKRLKITSSSDQNDSQMSSSLLSYCTSSALITQSAEKNNTALITTKKRKSISIDSLPSNYHALSISQLKSLCACNGLLHHIPKNATKADILEILDNEIIY